jgi:hypothetical protein
MSEPLVKLARQVVAEFSDAREGSIEHRLKVMAEFALASDREAIEAPILKVAFEKGLATGHGDTPEDMVREMVQGAFDAGFRAAGGTITPLIKSPEQKGGER